MVRQLYLVRHAEASAMNPNAMQPDYERELTERGIQEAQWAGQKLKEQEVSLQALFTSPAKRTYHTAQILAKALDFPLITPVKRLYQGEIEDYIDFIRKIDSAVNCSIMVGHNPSLTYLTHLLCSTPQGNLATCSIFGIEFDLKSWSDLGIAKGKLIFFAKPEL